MSPMFMKDLSELLRLAIAAYGAEIAELQEIRAQLLQLIEETPARSSTELGAPQKRGPRSAEARARISTAQKARWARDRQEKAVEPGAAQKRGPLSAEARAKISAAQKARWARDQKRNAEPHTPKAAQSSVYPETPDPILKTPQLKARLIKKASIPI
jgi:hypothetical protein